MAKKTICTTAALLSLSILQAVEPGLPSKTSIGAAARRALTARDYDPSIRNPDWLAEHFLGPKERAILGASEPAIRDLDRDYREAVKDQNATTANILIRTRFGDERLQNAVRAGGATQVVILGAGLDSRAYRMKELLKKVRVFEVDYGPTQEYKKLRVQEVLGCPPPNVTYVPIDFTREKLRDVLANAGYLKDRITFFLWEGVTQYIPEQAVRETLRFVATGSAPASSIVLDGKRKSFVDWVAANRNASLESVPQSLRPILATQKKYAEWGEPWIFGFPDGKEREFFNSTGLEIIELLPQDSTEAIKRYLTRRDGSVAYSAAQTLPSAPSLAGWLAEAVVPKR